MTSTILTFIAEVDPQRRDELAAAVQALRARMEQPNLPPFGSISTLHFASVIVFDEKTDRPLLVFEHNFDGPLDRFLPALLEAAGDTVHALFRCCRDYRVAGAGNRAGIEAYLRRHVVRPSAYHIGNVGRDVRRIRLEEQLHQVVQDRIDRRLLGSPHPRSDAEAYDLIHHEVASDPSFAWVREPHARQSFLERVTPRLRLAGTIVAAAVIAIVLLPLTLLAVGAFVLLLRWNERRDRPQPPTALDPDHVRRLAEQEDFSMQNHLASITTVKPGAFRRLTVRLVLFAANLLARTSTKGSLSGIPTIHYAHWSLIDRGRRLLFLSNFDGSWESYLDDFIDKANLGLTGIWSNTAGFPRTQWLVRGGASDGVAFKAFSRSQQTLEAVWYSAYPNLTVSAIQKHSTLREGLARSPRGAALREWLRLW